MFAHKHFKRHEKVIFVTSLFAVLALVLAACQPANSTSNSGVPVTAGTTVATVASGVATSVSSGVATAVPTMEAMATAMAPTVESLATSIAPTVSAAATSVSGAVGGSTVSNGQVSVANNAKLGNILVDSRGFTLYTFKPDGTSGKSTCNGQCATLWPALVVASGTQPSAGTGVTGTLGTTTRDDGSIQVTYNNMPLYFFSKDMAAGDANGQGIGGVWYAAVP